MNALRRVQLLALLVSILLSACIRAAPEVVKIGLSAPFEGRYREIGVDVIPAARLAVGEWASTHHATGLAFEITAYDDASDPALAMQVARRLVADPDVAIVVGHWRDSTTLAALPIYETADLPVVAMTAVDLHSRAPVYNLSPSIEQLTEHEDQWQSMQTFQTQIARDTEDVLLGVDVVKKLGPGTIPPAIGGPTWGMSQFYTLGSPNTEGAFFISGNALPQDSRIFTEQQFAEEFVKEYKSRSLGAPPGIFAVSAYQATWFAMTVVAESRGLRVTTPVAIPQFDSSGRIIDSSLYVYQWRNGTRRLIEILSIDS